MAILFRSTPPHPPRQPLNPYLWPVVMFKTTTNFNILNIPVHVYILYTFFDEMRLICILMKDVFALRLWWAAWELKEGLGSKSILMRKLTAEKAEICNAHCTNTLCNSVKNTKYKVQYMKYDVQTHRRKIKYIMQKYKYKIWEKYWLQNILIHSARNTFCKVITENVQCTMHKYDTVHKIQNMR